MSDLISREEAIEAMITLGIKRAVPILVTLPSVEPERKKGYWIVKDEDWRKQLEWDECSECGFTATKQYNFCPNCGADMRGDYE